MLERELEFLAAGALGGLLKRKARHAHALGTPCANCQTELQGPYCHVCGQSSDDQHRSILHLLWEGVEGLTHLDGRLGQTLPPLLLNPGKLARDHFEGRRQRHVPPFRLFLITLLIFMFVLESLFHGGSDKTKYVTTTTTTANGKTVTVRNAAAPPTVAAVTPGKDGSLNINIGKPPPDSGMAAITVNGNKVATTDGAAVEAAFDREEQKGRGSPFSNWLKPRLKRAVDNKDYYLMVLFTWAHRLAILLLPILAALLALVYVRRRQFYIYDHLIVAMQFLSFTFLISAAAWILPEPLRGWAVLIASIWTPINLYLTLRGAYGSRWYTAVIKTAFLWTSTLFLFGILMVGLMTLALAEMA